MFYSQDLLGRKSALGAVWVAAHGKKLSRARIMGVNVPDTCKKLLDPDVPQALRLQAILVGGVVVVYHKQSLFLLEDCNEMLKRLTTMTNADSNAMTLGKGKDVAKPEAITMPDPDVLAYTGSLFPSFPSQTPSISASRAASSEATDDLFMMPSLPDEPTSRGGGDMLALALNRNASGGRGRSAGLFDDGGVDLQLDGLMRHDYTDQPETFEVPDVDMGMFQMQSPGMAGMPPGPDEAPMFVEDPLLLAPSEEQQPEEAAPADNKRKRGGRRAKKTVIDDRQDIQIPLREMQGWIRDTSDLVRDPAAAALAAAKPAAIDFGPATAVSGSFGAWPPELMEIYNRAATLGGGRKPAEEVMEEEEGEEEGRAGRFGGAYTQDPMLPGADYVDYGVDGMMPEGDPMAEFGAYRGLDLALDAGRDSNPFRRRAREPRASADPSEEGFDIETERLRAALNGEGSGLLDDFLPAGPTPASAVDELPAGRGRRGRSSGALLPDSEGRALSEKSSGGRRRLSDLPEGELASDGDLGAMLPAVGEEEPYLDSDPYAAPPLGGASRKRTRQGTASQDGTGGTGTFGTLSQYQLLEESAPDAGAAPPPALITDSMSPSSLAFIQVLRNKFSTLESQDVDSPAELSFFALSARLSRTEAAKLFYQILVTRSHSFISAEQSEAYGDITLGRGPYL